jgi:prepilin-type N-terminal cleavage/methylation domain-containing protein
MSKKQFYNAPAANHSQVTQSGFTLVEIAIVMIIIGLLIGGIFGGITLVENSQINRTGQDLKAIESAAITFRYTYGRLPGDLRSPNTRLPNCTAAPCAVTGNSDRIVGPLTGMDAVDLTVTSEEFVFWHHLQAADLLAMDYSNINDMNFGVGQPSAPIGGGYRIVGFQSGTATTVKIFTGHTMRVANAPIQSRTAAPAADRTPYNCKFLRKLDNMLDDDMPRTGKITSVPACNVIPGNDMSGYGNPTVATGFSYYFSW